MWVTWILSEPEKMNQIHFKQRYLLDFPQCPQTELILEGCGLVHKPI